MQEVKVCDWCGKEFKPNRSWQRFCPAPASCKDSFWNKDKCDRLRKKPDDDWKKDFVY